MKCRLKRRSLKSSRERVSAYKTTVIRTPQAAGCAALVAVSDKRHTDRTPCSESAPRCRTPTPAASGARLSEPCQLLARARPAVAKPPQTHPTARTAAQLESELLSAASRRRGTRESRIEPALRVPGRFAAAHNGSYPAGHDLSETSRLRCTAHRRRRRAATPGPPSRYDPSRSHLHDIPSANVANGREDSRSPSDLHLLLDAHSVDFRVGLRG